MGVLVPRGGSTTARWTGADRELLDGAVNAADHTAHEFGAPWAARTSWPELDDGFVLHAPVDALRPSPFGLRAARRIYGTDSR